MPDPAIVILTARFFRTVGEIAIALPPSPFTPAPKIVAVGGAGGGGGISDGDKGDVIISGGGTSIVIDPTVLTSAGRSITGAASAAAQRDALGLGTAATASSSAFDAAGAAAAAVATHVSEGDPHPAYLTEAAAAVQLALKADLVGGVIPTSQIPAQAVSDFLGDVASQSAMLALSGQRGDWCIRTDLSRTAFLIADDASVLANWRLIETPASPVTSVNGQSGVIVLAAADVGATPADHAGAAGSAHPAASAGGPAGFMSGADKTKLDGIAAGATANASDADLVARANHSGQQSASTISDLGEAVQDIVGSMVSAAGGSYDDAAGSITLPGARDSRERIYDADFSHVNAVQGPFIIAAVGTGTLFTGAPNAAAMSANHDGILRLVSGTTANSGIAIMTSVTHTRIGGGERYDCYVYTAPVFTSVTQRAGLFDSATSTVPVDGLFFNMAGSGAIVGRNRNNNSETATATLATLAASTWYHLRMTVNADATSVTYEVFSEAGALLGSEAIAGNIPTARESGWGFFVYSSNTSATELAHIDRMVVSNPGRVMQRGAA